MRLKPCPGLYCGRMPLENGTYSSCSACPWGFRRNEQTICVPCTSYLRPYDWFYFSSMVLLSVSLQLFYINRYQMNKKIFLVFSFIVETAIAVIGTILVLEPKGEFSVQSCNAEKLSDWFTFALCPTVNLGKEFLNLARPDTDHRYTLFNNPVVRFTEKLHCTQEAVYPLYSMVLLYHLFSIATIVTIRPIVQFFVRKYWPTPRKKEKNLARHGHPNPIYAALYFTPVQSILHCILAGLLYYTFPFICLFVSILLHAAFNSYCIEKEKNMFWLKRVFITILHWAAHTFGIVGIMHDNLSYVGPFLALIPLPTIYFFLTTRFTTSAAINLS